MFMNKTSLSKDDGKGTDASEKYKIRYNHLRKYMIALVYVSILFCKPYEFDYLLVHYLMIHCRYQENTALCDQVTYMQEKILHIKEENNFFARKLKHIEFTRMAAGKDAFGHFSNFTLRCSVS